MFQGFLSTDMIDSTKKSFAILITPPKWWTVLAAVAGSTFVSLPQSYQLLVSVMGASLVSGFFVALRKRSLCPWDGFNSIIRRVAELGLLYITHEVFDAFGNHFGVPINLTPVVALIFTGIEFLALIEDCKTLGVPVPVVVTSQMKRLQDVLVNSAQASVETQTTRLSPAGKVIGIEQSVTTIRTDTAGVAAEPLIVPASETGKKES